ncbi:peptidoglycan DD-metalloendopeptidase family protein [Pseudomonas gingeri]|uniref:Peptidoglycan DD-metalloendopeptidase family protein n=1 Tax=Pseudomonas gingeri TaxID=117681 RepID=A0A7Y8C0I5_9PSED|nr:peptidoglycan DD-metalloendopeptidase family protein [Pseudomonas gingeri]NWD68225.1 peptidoglycan DD-metalloendopeptidase family protein [Pseudomonas gingeri]
MSLTVIRQRMGKASVQRLMIGLALSALLAGCSSAPKNGVRVVDRNGNATTTTANAAPQKPMTTTGQHVVARGDTLFSIAFRYGWDWKALAARNNIPEPYTIHVGQAIRFDSRSNSTPAAVASSSSGAASTASPSGKFTITRRPANAASGTATTVQPATQTPVAQTPAPPAGPAPKGWAWPSNGILIGKFSSNGSLNKGIDIAGDLGQPVLAASDGSVVYAGSGLRGYGELVIIKHSDTYVSAYGHNRRLLVREGQQVKAGQTIAEMGSTGTDRVKLHFEIRRQGKPVDPLQFLPRR